MQHNKRLLLVALLLALIGGVAAAQGKVTVVGRSVVLTGKSALALFKQCSRASPKDVERYWTPSASDIRNLNSALPDFLKTQRTPPQFHDYYRQCAGFIRKGEKYIYVNAVEPEIKEFHERLTREEQRPFNWKRDPMVVCDGGDSFFGMEFHVKSRKFSNLSVNGIM